MSHANAATQQLGPVEPLGRVGRLTLLRRTPVVRTPSGPILERRRVPRVEIFARAARAPAAEAEAAERAKEKAETMPRIRITRPLDTLPPGVPPRESFVLSRLSAAGTPLDELIALCPHPPIEVLRILDRWAAAGFVVLG